ncbi:MAG: hypothetical protein LBB88_05595 [Planctomycetaceae bacterium]|jgi:hypothetical protein|nr:hypothetical protein [Planctomycetaceae bacterium]
MNREKLLNLVSQIKPFNVKRYLLTKKWQESVCRTRDDICILTCPDDKYKQVCVPRQNNYQRYATEILSIIQFISQIEQREITSLITNLLDPAADILQFRLQSEQTESGSLSLGIINKFILSIRDSLRAAVSDKLFPTQLHHNQMKNKAVTQALEKAQFGQTEYGSFIIQVIAPIDIYDTFSVLPSMQDNIIRNGIIHILKSVQTIIKAIQNCAVDTFIQEFNCNLPLFSNNLVNALVDMRLWEDTTIEIATNWSSMLPPPENIPDRVIILPDYFNDIIKIGSSLNIPITQQPIEYFTGFVTELCGDTNKDNEKYGETKVNVTTRDNDNFNATISLNVEEHKLAIKAYEQNLPINFIGKVVRKGQYREIAEVKEFKIFEFQLP